MMLEALEAVWSCPLGCDAGVVSLRASMTRIRAQELLRRLEALGAVERIGRTCDGVVWRVTPAGRRMVSRDPARVADYLADRDEPSTPREIASALGIPPRAVAAALRALETTEDAMRMGDGTWV